jgi:hypothetical protein
MHYEKLQKRMEELRANMLPKIHSLQALVNKGDANAFFELRNQQL